MPAPAIVLYHTPGTCSRVTMNALEEIGLDYRDEPIDIFKGEQRTPAYLAVNPKGKVPALAVDESLITETPAILWRLATGWPAAGLLPAQAGADELAGLVDLSWFSNTLHVLVRAVRMPIRATTGDPAPVQEAAVIQLTPLLSVIDARLQKLAWWYGDAWSIVDVYLAWVFGMAEGGGMPTAAFPALIDHTARVRARPSFVCALRREQAAIERAGIEMPGGATL